MRMLDTVMDQRVVVPAASVALNPSWESDWGNAIYSLVRRAADEGRTVTVSVIEGMLTPQEASARADVSRMTIMRRIDDGTIRAVKRGSHWRIPESELQRYVAEMWTDTVAVVANDF